MNLTLSGQQFDAMATRERKTIPDHFQPAFEIIAPGGSVTTPLLQPVNDLAGRFVFTSPHSGRLYPASFIDQSRLNPTQLRSSEDAFVDQLFAHTAAQGAHFLHSLVPRAYLDLNRQPFELDPKLFAEPLPDFAISDTVKVKSGLGVIARVVSEGRQIYSRPLPLDDALQRINHLYFPYHRALRTLLDNALEKYQQAILIDCHSMPSGQLPGFKLVPPDFVLGNRFDKSCDYELTHLVRAELQSMGYIVSVNKPYAGGYVTRKYGRPETGVHALQIEINRRLYLDERTMKKHKGFEKLRKNMMRLSEKIMRALPDLSLTTRLAAE